MEKILQAANGVEALTLLACEPVHLVLTDLHMPEMGGEELIRRMQASAWVSIPVVIVSAEPSAQRMEALCRSGARGYLRKPFTPENIRSVIVPLLEESR